MPRFAPATLPLACLLLAPGAALAFGPDLPPPSELRAKPRARVIDLRPRFKLGQEIRFDIALSDREVTKPGEKPASKAPASAPKAAPKAATFTEEVGLRLKVSRIDPDGSCTLDTTIESFKMRGNGPVGEIDFDSTRAPKPGDPFEEVFRSITKVALKVQVDRDGEVRSITPQGDGAGASALGQAFTGGDMFRSLVGPISSPRRGATSASVGETWTEESSMGGSAGSWTLEVTKTLRSVQGSRATIDMKGRAKLDPASIGAAPGANAQSDTVYEGQAIWDAELGMLERFESRLRSSVGLLAGLGNLGDLAGGAGGIGEDGAESKPSLHETTVRVTRVGR